MNFIITMISNSYETINSDKENYNFRERSKMIYQREVRFNEKDFSNNIWFPKLLVVRKKQQEAKQWSSSIIEDIDQIKENLTERREDFNQHIEVVAHETKEMIFNIVSMV
jgi:ABC-type polar amino acid transport system ATPase subunit